MARANNPPANPSTQMENPSNPFFLHSGDHPGLVLVSHPLSTSNYNTWSRAMIMALTAKTKLGFVNGSVSRPISTDLSFGNWSRCNSMVSSWLLNAVTKEIADSLIYHESAAAIWNDLHERFHRSNGPRVFQLKQQLVSLSQGSSDVSSYYTKTKILWDELKDYIPIPTCHCGGMESWVSFQQNESVMQFLMGLNESFSHIRAQIFMMDPLPSLTKVFSLIVQEELQRTIGAPIQTDPIPFAAAGSAPHRGGTSRYGTNRPKCTHCGVLGHTIEKCYRIHGFPPGYKQNRSSSPRANSTVFEMNRDSSVHPTQPIAPSSLTAPPLQSLSHQQWQHLLQLLGSSAPPHSNAASSGVETNPVTSPTVCNFMGPHSKRDDWDC